jgi:hypothetical protein
VAVNRLNSGSIPDRDRTAGPSPALARAAQPSPRDRDSNPEACLLGLPTKGRGPAAPLARSFLKSMAWISLSENLNRWYLCLHFRSTIQTGLATRDGLIEPREKAKNLERGFVSSFGNKIANKRNNHVSSIAALPSAWLEGLVDSPSL